jgi:hypothetical protein
MRFFDFLSKQIELQAVKKIKDGIVGGCVERVSDFCNGGCLKAKSPFV